MGCVLTQVPDVTAPQTFTCAIDGLMAHYQCCCIALRTLPCPCRVPIHSIPVLVTLLGATELLE